MPVEPQVFALLLLLAENRERLVSRDEIIEKVWDGRVVSDSALDSRVKSARRALGDDGKAQRFIRTIHGQGFRFVAEVKEAAPASSAVGGRGRRRVSRAKPMPSRRSRCCRSAWSATPGRYAAIADALPDELIAELSRLRWLFVIARGSSFRFRSPAPDPAEVGKLLGVRYCLSGTVEIAGATLAVTVQLVDTQRRRRGVGRPLRVEHRRRPRHARARSSRGSWRRSSCRSRLNEARAARLVAPENLDAWSAYHLGLQHMFRFNRRDNAVAGGLFERAIADDPRFARAHAGLSFVHFQNAFLRYTPDLAAEVGNARRFAERSVELDPLDPFANLTMGRSFWLDGRSRRGLGMARARHRDQPELRAGNLCAGLDPCALGSRRVRAGRTPTLAMALSPLDPLHYAMAATRAFSHIVCGETAEAAAWADKAARSPGAHVLIAMIAVAAHGMHGDPERAAAWAANVRERNPALTATDFFRSFPFADPAVRQRVAKALAASGI